MRITTPRPVRGQSEASGTWHHYTLYDCSSERVPAFVHVHHQTWLVDNEQSALVYHPPLHIRAPTRCFDQVQRMARREVDSQVHRRGLSRLQ